MGAPDIYPVAFVKPNGLPIQRDDRVRHKGAELGQMAYDNRSQIGLSMNFLDMGEKIDAAVEAQIGKRLVQQEEFAVGCKRT